MAKYKKSRKKKYKRDKEKIPTLVHTQEEDYYVRQDPNIDIHTLNKDEARMIRFLERGKRRGRYVGGDDTGLPRRWSQPSGEDPHYIERQGRKFRKPIKKKKGGSVGDSIKTYKKGGYVEGK